MRINCLKCKYYQNTWDQYNPRGCSLYHIKTKIMPSAEVKKSSGEDCQGFELSQKHKKTQAQEVDLNDDKFW